MWRMNNLSLVSIIRGWKSWKLAFEDAPDYDPAKIFNDLLQFYPKMPMVVWLEEWRTTHVLRANPVAAAIEALLKGELFIDLDTGQFTTENNPCHFAAKALVNTLDYLKESRRLELPESHHVAEVASAMLQRYQVAVLLNDGADRGAVLAQAAQYDT